MFNPQITYIESISALYTVTTNTHSETQRAMDSGFKYLIAEK